MKPDGPESSGAPHVSHGKNGGNGAHRAEGAGGSGVTEGSGGTDVGELAVELRLACMRISRRVRFESAADELPPHQFSVLTRLDRGTATPGELADIEKVSAPSMTRTVSALVEAGLVAREDNPADRRQVVLRLTGSGRERLRAVRARRDLWMATRLAQLPERDLAVLRAAAPLLAQVATE